MTEVFLKADKSNAYQAGKRVQQVLPAEVLAGLICE